LARTKSLAKRFGNEPITTAKAEFKKLPIAGKILVGAAILGAIGGATVAPDIAQRLGTLDVGGVVSKSAAWGSNLASRLRPMTNG